MADKEQTHGGHMVDTHEADTGGGQGLEARPKRTCGGRKADNGGHMVDKRRPFFLKCSSTHRFAALQKSRRNLHTNRPEQSRT